MIISYNKIPHLILEEGLILFHATNVFKCLHKNEICYLIIEKYNNKNLIWKWKLNYGFGMWTSETVKAKVIKND